jgi:aldose sugar dehydrogenase
MHVRRALAAVLLILAGLVTTQVLGAGQSQREVQPTPSPPNRATRSASPVAGATLRLPRAPDRGPQPASPPPATSSDVVAVALSKDNKIALIDTLAGRVSKTIDAGLAPGQLTLSPDGQSAWVVSTKPGQSSIAVVDMLKTAKRDDRHFRDGDGPAAVAFSRDGSRAYVAMDGDQSSPPSASTIAFVNVARGSELGRVNVGRQTAGVQIRRQLSSLAVSQDVLYAAARASGVVWALDAGSGAAISEIEVGGGPFSLVPDEGHQRVYALIDTLNQVVAIDTQRQAIANRIQLPARPSAAVVGGDGTVYVVGGDTSGELWVIAPGATAIGASAQLSGQPVGVAIGTNDTVYVADATNRAVTVYNATTLQPTATIKLSGEPNAIVTLKPPAQAPRPAPTPTPGPSIVPTPTPLPEGARPPEHLPEGAVSEDFLGGAELPVSIAFAPDGRLFYNELRTGKIRVVQNGVLLPDPFYQFAVAGQPETGLIGLTLDPDFAHNHYLYVFYTSVPDGAKESGGTNGPNEVVRLTDGANKGTDLTPIVAHLPSGPIHNAGTLRFGPDGKLYVALGENDQAMNAQDLSTLPGKILRFNADGSVPDDNPFAGQPGKQGAIWAYGLRNPYSFAFHPIGHELLAVENGPGDNDELDTIARGANYGWPPTGYKYKTGVADPIAVMNPPIGPTGSTFYVGDQVPEWRNDWFYCNYHQGQLRRVHLAPDSYDRVVFEEVVKQGCSFDVATGPDGALYYSDAKGIYRIRQPGANVLPAVVAARDAPATPTPETLPAGTRPEDRDVNVTLSEWKTQPSRTTVPAGTIRILAENVGATQHALRIVGGDIDVSTEAYGPAQSRTLQIALSAGTYQVLCPIPGHAEQGMRTTLTVVGSS